LHLKPLSRLFPLLRLTLRLQALFQPFRQCLLFLSSLRHL
jgi:hypothetical protein